MAAGTNDTGTGVEREDAIQALRLHKEFSTRKAASRYVRDFALSQGKRAVVDAKTSGGNNFTLRCDSGTPCSFFVKLAKSRAAGVRCLRITSFNAKHDGCSGTAKATCAQAVRFAVTDAAVIAQPTIAAKVLISQVRTAEGVQLSQRMAYRARDTVREVIEGSVQEGFAALESLLATYREKNSGAFTAVQFNIDGRFRRALLSHPYVKQHCENGQRVFEIEGTFMKHGQYPSVMLILVGRDSNNRNVMIGVCVCDGETGDNAEWFLACCERAGVSFKDTPVFTDRGKALLFALGNRPEAIIRFCTCHIIGNVASQFGKIASDDVEDAIWALQASESENEFNGRLKAIESSHKEIAAYLEKINRSKWILYPCLGKTRLYGWRTTNFVESENGAAILVRYLHAFGVFNHYTDKCMSRSVESDDDSQKAIK